MVSGVVEAETREGFLIEVLKRARRIGGYSGEALQKAKKLTIEASGDVEARREAGEREGRDLTVMFEREDTKRRLAAFGGRKVNI